MAAVAQVSIFSQVHVFGAVPDVLLVSLVALALLRGSVVGAVGGFFAGLIVDTASLGTLGLTSLVLTLAGYWIGRYGETTGRDRAHAPFLSVAVVTVLYQLGLLVVHFVLGESAPAGAVVRSLAPGDRPQPDPHRADLRARAAAAAAGRAGRADARRCSSLASTTTGVASVAVARGRRSPRPRSRRGRALPADAEARAAGALLGALVVIGFAALLLRLWALQVLAGPQYAARAQANQLRTVRVEAPRGPIVDRNGNILVTNKPVTAVELWPSGLPKVYARRVPRAPRARARHARERPPGDEAIVQRRQARATCSTRSSSAPRRPAPMLTYLEERAGDFPGVTLARSYVRRYPHGSLAAAAARLRRPDLPRPSCRRSGRRATSRATRSARPGSRRRSTRTCAAFPGAARVRVDSLGRPRSAADARRRSRSRGRRCA